MRAAPSSRLLNHGSLHDDIPTFLGRLHGRFRTPYVAVLLFAVASVLVLLPGYWSPLIFQNMGHGTCQHSGLLAIRAAVASKANITFKILYNDAVAMTGGQPAEGVIDPLRITRQLAAEGVG